MVSFEGVPPKRFIPSTRTFALPAAVHELSVVHSHHESPCATQPWARSMDKPSSNQVDPEKKRPVLLGGNTPQDPPPQKKKSDETAQKTFNRAVVFFFPGSAKHDRILASRRVQRSRWHWDWGRGYTSCSGSCWPRSPAAPRFAAVNINQSNHERLKWVVNSPTISKMGYQNGF